MEIYYGFFLNCVESSDKQTIALIFSHHITCVDIHEFMRDFFPMNT